MSQAVRTRMAGLCVYRSDGIYVKDGMCEIYVGSAARWKGGAELRRGFKGEKILDANLLFVACRKSRQKSSCEVGTDCSGLCVGLSNDFSFSKNGFDIDPSLEDCRGGFQR